MSFVHLHTHTSFSLLDGATKIEPLAKRIAELGMPACAITDHGNLYGAIEFYKACKKEKVKPIIGCEVYVAPESRFDRKKVAINEYDTVGNYHLVLLAINDKGYKNLCRMVSLAFLEGFYYKPRVDKDLLEKHNEGIIALSGCFVPNTQIWSSGGRLIEIGQIDSGAKPLNRFGKSDNITIPTIRPYTGKLFSIKARRYNIPILCTEDHQWLVLTSKHKLMPGHSLNKAITFRQEPHYKRADKLTEKDWVLMPINTKHKNGKWSIHIENLPNSKYKATKIEAGNDVAELLGWYIAEGNATDNYINFTLGLKEINESVWIKNQFDQLGYLAKITKRPEKGSIEIRICSTALAKKFKELFGQGAINKRLPYFLKNMSISQKFRLLKGLFNGDGWDGITKFNTRRITFASISKQLAIDVYQLLLSLNVKPHLWERKANKNHKKSWYISISGPQAEIFHDLLIDKAISLDQFKQINKGLYYYHKETTYVPHRLHIPSFKNVVDQEVRCIEMQNDPSFLAEGFVVHNCLASEVNRTIASGDISRTKEIIDWYRTVFADRYYIEIQDNHLDDQNKANEVLVTLAKELSLPLVATNDCHYLDPEDYLAHEALLCVQTNKTLNDPSHWSFGTDQLYVKGPLQMRTTFCRYPEAISNTVRIAEQCNVEFEFGKYQFPTYQISERTGCIGENEPPKTPEEELNELAWYGLLGKFPGKLSFDFRPKTFDQNLYDIYVPRLNYELEQINNMNLASYMLIVYDLIRFAREKGIPVGPGRGSVAGSLVAYCLGITDIDPIPYNLLFERFINPDRVSMPDIDMDFCIDRREEVIEYVKEKYGDEQVANIVTFGSMKGKAAIRDIGRALGLQFLETDKLSKLYPAPKHGKEFTLAQALVMEPKLEEIRTSGEREKTLFRYALTLENVMRHSSKHAAGIVISKDPLINQIPLCKDKDGNKLTQYDMRNIDELGFIKFDFLGLKTLTFLDSVVKYIKKTKNIDIDLSKLDLQDKETYELIKRADTTGCFQIESNGMKNFISQLKPDCFEDLIAVLALFRPGPLDSGMVDSYVKRKHGLEEVEYIHPSLESVLKPTYGTFCIAKDSNVLTKTGIKKIQDVTPDDLVKTEDGSWQPVIKTINNGIKETIRIRLNNGEELVCTPDHRVLTSAGWQEAGNLARDDLLKSIPFSESIAKEIGNDKDWCIGLAIADGNLCGTTVDIACSSESNANFISDAFNKAFGITAYSKKRGRSWYSVLKDNNAAYHSNKFTKYLRNNFNLYGKDCYSKRLPNSYTLAMLAGFIEGDGSLINNRIRLKNKELAYDIFLALQSYEIPSSYYEDKDGAFCVSFHDYENKLPFKFKKRKSKLEFAVQVPRFYLPRLSRPNKDRRHNTGKNPGLSIDIVKRNSGDIKHALWSRVLSVKPAGKREVYDLSVKNIHSFTVGGHIVHNCYQEQIMSAAQILANYTLGEADLLRRAMGKKDSAKMAIERDRFVTGCLANNIDGVQAAEIFDKIERFADYGFNKSHSAAYALISFRTAYLKAHYLPEFLVCLLNADYADEDKTFKNISECRKHGIEILPPSINHSDEKFTLHEGKIRFGLCAIKNMSSKAAQFIMRNRPKEGYIDLADFCHRCFYNNKPPINKKAIDALILCGAFDELGFNRRQLFEGYEKSVQWAVAIREEGEEDFRPRLPNVLEYKESIKLDKEKEILGFYVTGHPLDKYKKEVERMTNCNSETIPEKESGSEIVVCGVVQALVRKNTRKGDRYASFILEDHVGTIDIIVWPKQYQRYEKLLIANDPICIKGRVENREDRQQLFANEIILLSNQYVESVNEINLEIENKNVDLKFCSLKSLCEKYPGSIPINVILMSSTKILKFQLPFRLRVAATYDMMDSIKTLGNVTFI